MYFQQAEHNPPHIHALYGEDMAAVEISTGKVLDGHLPNKALGMVKEWISFYETELLHMWNNQEFIQLPPLE